MHLGEWRFGLVSNSGGPHGALATQPVFEKFMQQPNGLSAPRATNYVGAPSESDLSDLHACPDDDQAAVDLAIESAFGELS
jgi:hypothetical protein